MRSFTLPARFTAVGIVLLLTAATGAAQITTGPEVGERIPELSLRDQDGRTRTLADLSGPEGLLLLFHRSADW